MSKYQHVHSRCCGYFVSVNHKTTFKALNTKQAVSCRASLLFHSVLTSGTKLCRLREQQSSCHFSLFNFLRVLSNNVRGSFAFYWKRRNQGMGTHYIKVRIANCYLWILFKYWKLYPKSLLVRLILNVKVFGFKSYFHMEQEHERLCEYTKHAFHLSFFFTS